METTKYSCIFESKSCPAKTAWKLSPESLVEFCKICVEKMKWDTLNKALEAFVNMQVKSVHPEALELEKLQMEHDIELKKLDIESERTKQAKAKDQKCS